MEELNREDIVQLIVTLTVRIEDDERDFQYVVTDSTRKYIQQSIKHNKAILSKLKNMLKKYV